MDTFHLSIFEAEGVFYQGECEYVSVPATDGTLGVLAHRAPLVCALKEGLLVYRLPGGINQYAAISDGLMKVEKNDVTVMASTIERPEDIDEARALAHEREAEEAMRQKMSATEYASAKAIIARNANRLRIKHTRLNYRHTKR